jgi:hypothetical protein
VLVQVLVFGEELAKRIVQREQSVLLGKADRDGNEGFGGRVHTVLKILVEGGVVALGKEVVTAGKNDRVGGKVPEIQLLVKVQYVARGNAHLFGGSEIHHHMPPGDNITVFIISHILQK